MSEWIRSALDIVLIAMVAAGLVQAARLIRHLAGLQQGRVEMERFVREFSATVYRAEAGIKGLKNAARETGDDLEKLVDKGIMIRDELNYIVESADQIAERLSNAAHVAAKPEPKPAAPKTPAAGTGHAEAAAPSAPPAAVPASRAEKELLQALQKLT